MILIKKLNEDLFPFPNCETQINSEDVSRKKLNKPLKKAAISPFLKGHIAQNQPSKHLLVLKTS